MKSRRNKNDVHSNGLEHHATGSLGKRIAAVADSVGGRRRLAYLAGISESQLYRYLSGQSQPTVVPLILIAQVGGVSLQWLATGEGNMHLSEVDDPPRGVDPKLLEECIATAEDVLHELERPLESVKKAQLITALYELQLESGNSLERATVLRLLKSMV